MAWHAGDILHNRCGVDDNGLIGEAYVHEFIACGATAEGFGDTDCETFDREPMQGLSRSPPALPERGCACAGESSSGDSVALSILGSGPSDGSEPFLAWQHVVLASVVVVQKHLTCGFVLDLEYVSPSFSNS